MPEIFEEFRIVAVLVLGALAWFGVQVLLRGIRRMLRARVEGLEAQKRLDTVMTAIRYSLNLLLAIVGIVLLLAELGVAIAPILGAAGVVGIAAGFAAQSLVKDFFRGAFLLIENQVRVGDVVEVAGRGGLVEEVTLRYLRLRDYEGNVHFVPNGEITVVTNRSIGFAYALVDVGIAYRSDIDQAIALLREVADGLRDDDAFRAAILEPIEIAGVERLADSAVVIRSRIKVAPLQQWNVRREMLRRVKQRYDAAGVEIPYPHLTLYHGDRPADKSAAIAVADPGRAAAPREAAT